MILLDTNVVSELMKGAPEPSVMVWINARPAATVFLSAVTQAEILYGIALVPEGKRRDGLARAARIAWKLTVNMAISRASRLERKNKPMPMPVR